MALLRHRGCEGPPRLLLTAVAVFALAMTWRLTIRTGAEATWREPLFMLLVLGSGGVASVAGLQYLLRPPAPAVPESDVGAAQDPMAPAGIDALPEEVRVERAVSAAVVHHVEIPSGRPSLPEEAGPVAGLESIRSPARPLASPGWMTASELGERAAAFYRSRGESVEIRPDPADGAADLVVLGKGRRRVVHCIVGPNEVTPSAIRELVGFRDIEHADDATLVTTIPGTENAQSLAVEQGIQWIGPAELSEWAALAKDA